MTRLDRAQTVYRVRRVDRYGTVRDAKFYVLRTAAARRADHWRDLGWRVEVAATDVVKFRDVEVDR